MSRGGCPSRVRELTPHINRSLAFTLWKIFKAITGKRDRWETIGLRTKLRVVFMGPCVHRFKKILVGKFGERLSPVVPDRRRIRTSISNEGREQRHKIVAAPPLELIQQLRSPI